MSGLIWLLVLIIHLPFIQSDFFSSHHGLVNLVNIQKLIYEKLDSYMMKEQERLNELRSIRNKYYKLYHQSNQDLQSYLSNPINVFHLIRRLAVDWTEYQNLMSQQALRHEDEFKIEFDNFTNPNVMPSNEDLEGSYEALVRIQDVYDLDSSDIAKGIINYPNDQMWLKSKSEMNFEECLEMASYFNRSGDYQRAAQWCKEGYQRYKTNQKVSKINIDMWCNSIKEVKGVNSWLSSVYNNYEALCRGQEFINPKKKAKLKCYYKKSLDKLYLQLERIKVEEVHKHPDAFIYHDVISDREIEELKSIGSKYFSRAEVFSPTGGVVSSVRVSKVSWIPHHYNNMTKRLIKRFEEFSGLSVNSAEDFQLSNYGLGGQYDPHVDYFTRQTGNLIKVGNRIATWLCYLSDVESGGHTVFPKLGVGVRPQKGSALFWYNLETSGEGNKMTLHAACPVLVGTKWVVNVWFRERGQELLRPCGLKFLEY